MFRPPSLLTSTAAIAYHWGPNWGYQIPDDQIVFAHRLIEEGFHIVHGHSSHHVKAIEVYRNGLILYGCGDFLTDYEGISGYEWFRSDMAVMYLAKVDSRRGLSELCLVPMQSKRFRLLRILDNAQSLADLLSRLGAAFGTTVRLSRGPRMSLRWRHS